jgi:NosR/NirI family nitrous oxide reductase transcriptional regulator
MLTPSIMGYGTERARDIVRHSGRCPGWHWLGLAIACVFLLAQEGWAADEVAVPSAWLQETFPNAIELGPAAGSPPAREVHGADGQVIGYVLSTQDVIQSKGFSGKPINILVGLDTAGIIRGAYIVEHHEPILIIGVSNADFDAFIDRYKGVDVRTPVTVTDFGTEGVADIDAISGATISSIVINDTILRAARAVARSRGLLGGGALDFESFAPAGWQELVAEGSLVPFAVTIGEAERALSASGARLYPAGVDVPPPDAPLLNLYFGLATPARVGQNLLGAQAYNRVMAGLSEGDQLVFVGGTGAISFKGAEYRQTGVFDRIQIVQGDRTFTLHREDYRPIEELKVAGAPPLRDLALFRIAADRGFDPGLPWRLEVLVPSTGDGETDVRAIFSKRFELPDLYRRMAEETPAVIERPLWHTTWLNRHLEIAILASALVVLSLILLFQDWLVRRKRLYSWVRIGFLSFTLLWLGWYAGAQLSVLNVLAFFDAVRQGFDWNVFLLEPLMFILWGFVAVTLLFWARGVFCGWLCPFGALQELANKIATRFRIPQPQVPTGIHERLIALKYIIFLVVFGISLGAFSLAQSIAEVEPFKTAIILKFDRQWPFVLYAVALVGIGLFIPRAFCRYLCPLGAALAIPARLHMFRWLRRRRECGSPCQQCAVTCPVQAIHPRGHINPSECIHCLHCQAYYYDNEICPPLLRRQKMLDRLAARDT